MGDVIYGLAQTYYIRRMCKSRKSAVNSVGWRIMHNTRKSIFVILALDECCSISRTICSSFGETPSLLDGLGLRQCQAVHVGRRSEPNLSYTDDASDPCFSRHTDRKPQRSRRCFIRETPQQQPPIRLGRVSTVSKEISAGE